MAFYIEINKISEDGFFTAYTYGFYITVDIVKNKAGKLRGKSKLVTGELQLEKKSGEIKVIKSAEGENGLYVQRAIVTLLKYWEKGELPDKICRAS